MKTPTFDLESVGSDGYPPRCCTPQDPVNSGGAIAFFDSARHDQGLGFVPTVLQLKPAETAAWINDDGRRMVCPQNRTASDVMIPVD